MRPSTTGLKMALLASLICGAFVGVQAQTGQPTSGFDRLFLSFAQDATVVETQWWEAQVELIDFDSTDAVILRGIAAFQPLQDVEIGVSVGFGSTDAPPPLPDGSGATDLDVWGKYYLTGESKTEFALGGLVTIPTGDDSSGLGADSFRFEAFGSLRHSLERLIVVANVGIGLNEDGRIQGVPLEGENSPFIAGGVIVPLSDQVSVVGEARVEAERFERADTDFRLLGGINWRPYNRGMFRGAVAVGVTDGAPDSQIIGGYAYTF